MKRLKKAEIIIPQGRFEGKCEDCIHATRTGQDRGNLDKGNREMYCAMYRKTFFPRETEETNCSHYKMKLWSKVKLIASIALIIYFGIAIIAVILGI